MRLSRTSSRVLLVGREALDELVERALGVEHHRPQLALHLEPAASKRSGRRAAARCRAPRARASWPAAWPGRSSPPRPCAPRRPCPWRSPPTVVVLPTPPEPPQMHDALALEQLARRSQQPPPARSRERARARRGRARARTGRAASHRRAGAVASRAARAARAARARARARTARRAARRARPACPRSSSGAARSSAPGAAEALGQHAVDDDARQRACPSSSRAASRAASSVSLTGISSAQRDGDDAGAARGRRATRGSCAAWRAIGPTRAISAKVRGARSSASAVAGGRRVDDHEVVAARAPRVRRSGCASSHTLPMRQQLAHAGRRPPRSTGRCGCGAAGRPSRAPAADRAGTPRSRARGRSRSRTGPRPSSTSSKPAGLRRPKRPRRRAPGRRPRRRSCAGRAARRRARARPRRSTCRRRPCR